MSEGFFSFDIPGPLTFSQEESLEKKIEFKKKEGERDLTVDDIVYEHNSPYVYGGLEEGTDTERFTRISGTILVSEEVGRLRFSYLIPHGIEKYPSMIVGQLPRFTKDAMHTKRNSEERESMGRDMLGRITALIPYEQLESFAKRRDELGKYENITVIEMHGKHVPWQVSTHHPRKSKVLGSTEGLVNSFIDISRSAKTQEGPIDRMILLICNPYDQQLKVNQNIPIYYGLGNIELMGTNSVTPLEINPNTGKQISLSTGQEYIFPKV
ncbi:MAG TPA: hypothetical protein VLF89_03855 [Candidatus Saccharimonadales bacterium]|nr:hypothetical protein [Candidatus Saccharimonadales bacterium]